MHDLRLVLLGHGAIARYVVEQMTDVEGFDILAVICRDRSLERARVFAKGRFGVYTSIDKLPEQPDMLVDCAGHSGLLMHASDALERGIEVISVSSGALAEPGVSDQLEQSAMKGGTHIRFVSGAIAGIDALSAASVGTLSEVTYTGRKPPVSWQGTPAEEAIDLATLSEPFVHFSGSARDAARLYPKNANVAATIALASIGLDKVKVRLIADPGIDRNIHEINASGMFGRLQVLIEGESLPDNPGSSAIAAMSLVAQLRLRQRCLQI